MCRVVLDSLSLPQASSMCSLLTGVSPAQILPKLFWGTLISLGRKTGGLQPIIEIGYYWSRIASKARTPAPFTEETHNLASQKIEVGWSSMPRCEKIPQGNTWRVGNGQTELLKCVQLITQGSYASGTGRYHSRADTILPPRICWNHNFCGL